MNAYLKNIISEYLKQTNQNLSNEKTQVVKNTVNIDSDDIGTSTEGIKYHKSELIKYLLANGMSTDQYYIDMYARSFQIDFDDSDGDSDEVTLSRMENIQIEELDNLDDSDFSNYLSFLLLKSITDLNNSLSNEKENKQNKEYAIECLYDNGKGGIDSSKLEELLNKYAERGWTLKTIFTNELGKNAASLGGFGVNSTQDQVIIVFER